MNTKRQERSEKDLAYDRIAGEWEGCIDSYDTQRRLETLVDDFLGRDRIEGRTCLDAGCGLGYFTLALLRHGPASVTSVDISPRLIERLHERCPETDAKVADLTDLEHAFETPCGPFDIIVSSDVIEHTGHPRRAIEQMSRYLKEGGLIALSVPNRRWKWLLHLARVLRLRKHYQGHENWVGPNTLKRWLDEFRLEPLRLEGVHTVPWHFLPKPVLRSVDQALKTFNYPMALNLAVLARKHS